MVLTDYSLMMSFFDICQNATATMTGADDYRLLIMETL